MQTGINATAVNTSATLAVSRSLMATLMIVSLDELANSDNGEGFWSNENGWVRLEHADRFSEGDREALNLPMGGSWIEEGAYLASASYLVVGKDPETGWFTKEFATAEEMEAAGYKREEQVGGDHLRKELRGKPCFDGLCGPTWGGYEGGKPVIRYETWPAYDILST